MGLDFKVLEFVGYLKNRARVEAECFFEEMKEIADEENLEQEWFIEEVVKNIHLLKNDNK